MWFFRRWYAHNNFQFYNLDAPYQVFPSIVADSTNSDDVYVGNYLYNNSVFCNAREPIKEGLVVDFESATHLWDYMYTDALAIFPEERPVMLCESQSDKQCREKCTEIFFERY